jgi:threonine synthase
VGFLHCVRQGLAKDGGLYVPENGPPTMTMDEWAGLLPLTYQERAVEILSRWISPDELSRAELTQMVADAYRGFGHCGDPDVVAPVVHLEGSHYILELFNGPTASFKDLALQLTPRLFDRAAQEADTKYMILVATSGDTGSAALEGFRNVGINTMVLYPKDGVSAIQRAQMTSTPVESTHTIGVDGDFDWCQTCVKTLFNDAELAAELDSEFGVTLSAANSINWGRLLPQVVYHSSAYLDLVNQGVVELGEPVDVCVPCGNFGNILAAVYAKAMGVPFRDFTVAANKNNVLSDFVMTGKYDLRKRELLKTISPSIDILISSNIERMLHLLCAKNPEMADAGAEVDRCFKQLKTEGYFELSPALFEMLNKEFTGGWATEEECGATIKSVFERTGYLLDPHTAVAKHVVDNAPRADETDVPMLISSTAHYGKFASDVVQIVGGSEVDASPPKMLNDLGQFAKLPRPHQQLLDVVTRDPVHKVTVGADLSEVKAEIKAFLARTR